MIAMIQYYFARYWQIGLVALVVYFFDPFGLFTATPKKRKKRKATGATKSPSKRRSTTGNRKAIQAKGLQKAKRVNSINAKIRAGQALSETDKTFKKNNPQYKWAKR